jgi:arabinofuranan 3-O-arabinosyltransferase
VLIEAPERPVTTAAPAGGEERIRERIRVAAFCLLLLVLPFVSAPGDLISDTKLDLAINPARFLARALTLWDPTQFGQLQNQAVGYLFPMGPYFLLGKLAGLPPWVIQRLWIGTVLIAAFLGTFWLAQRLGIGTPWTRILGGLCYAASPMALSLTGVESALFLPAAMLPWVLLPLAGPAFRGRGGQGSVPGAGRRGAVALARLRAVARSGLAVAACGGTNAAATVPILVVALLFILLRSGPVPRWRVLAWWLPAVALAIGWWVVPLLLLGKYGVSFLPYTESASVTTSVTSLWNILRGTEDWTSYLVMYGQPYNQLAYKIATDTVPIVLSGLIAGLGLAGLLRRGLPERRFLLFSVLAGLLIIGTGYVSGLGNPLASQLDHLINGPGAPLRNLWKFDPMIRLPVALGLAHLAAAHPDPDPERGPAAARVSRLAAAVPVVAALAVAALAVPAYISGLAAAGAYPQIPQYWVNAANWLDRHAGRQAVLVVPGAAFGQYLWGSPEDDVLEPLSTVDWAERDLTSIGSPGNERLIEAIDQRLAAGDGSAGLTQVLAQMGVKYLVVRNDLIRSSLSGAWPSRIRDALASSPGISEVAKFGAPAGGDSGPGDAVSSFDPPFPPVQIYQVRGVVPAASVVPASSALRVYGAPEATLTLAGEGLLNGRPVLLNADSPSLPAAASVVTDTLRRRVVNFGEVRTSYSPTMTAAQPARTFEAATDFTEPLWARYQSVAAYQGIRYVTASSSAAGIGTIPANWASGAMPYSAIDGNLRTMWESGNWTGPVGQWIQIGFQHPSRARLIRVTFADNAAIGPPVTGVEVSTAAGRMAERVRPSGHTQSLRVPAGASGWLRITVTRLAFRPHPVLGTQVGISEIQVPGLDASRVIVAPPVTVPGGNGDPSVVLLTKTEPQPSGCMQTPQRWVCSPALSTLTEEQYGFDQSFTEAAGGHAQLTGTVVALSTRLVRRYIRYGGTTWVRASSAYTADPEDQARSAFDGNPATTWVSGPDNPHPWLRIRWPHPRSVSQLTIQRPPGASGLLQVLVTGEGRQVRGGQVGPGGVLRFRPLRTSVVTLRFTPAQIPVQISDVSIPGVVPLFAPQGALRLPCGDGPLVQVNGKLVPTQVTGTFADLLTARPMRFTACKPVKLAAGSNRVVEPAADLFDIQDVVLSSSAARARLSAAGPAARPARVLAWTSQRRTIRVATAVRSFLVVPQNVNAGWQATLGGRRLRPVRLDGWEQAWLLPAGSSGTVTLTYLPNTIYQRALAGGLAALVLLGLLALRVGRRRGQVAAAEPIGSTGRFVATVSVRSPAPPAGGRARPRWARLLRVVRSVLIAAVLTGALLLTGFWLGGFPGAVIMTVATWLFMAAASNRRVSRVWVEFARPRLLATLLLAALICGVVGERLLWSGDSGRLVTDLWNTVPQVICLIIVARLAAALILPEP